MEASIYSNTHGGKHLFKYSWRQVFIKILMEADIYSNTHGGKHLVKDSWRYALVMEACR